MSMLLLALAAQSAPLPAADVPAPPPLAVARYVCGEGPDFTVAFDNASDRAILRFVTESTDVRELRARRAASGLWYSGGGWTLRGKGREAVLTGGGTERRCVAG